MPQGFFRSGRIARLRSVCRLAEFVCKLPVRTAP